MGITAHFWREKKCDDVTALIGLLFLLRGTHSTLKKQPIIVTHRTSIFESGGKR